MKDSSLLYILNHRESGLLESIQAYDLEWQDFMSNLMELKCESADKNWRRCCFYVHFYENHIYGFKKETTDAASYLTYSGLLNSFKDLIKLDPLTGKVEKYCSLNDLNCLDIEDYHFNENVSFWRLIIKGG
jgi:hypothetical protein